MNNNKIKQHKQHIAYNQNNIRNIDTMHFHCFCLIKNDILHIDKMSSGLKHDTLSFVLFKQKWHPAYTQNHIRHI